jgi:hypothetical protein
VTKLLVLVTVMVSGPAVAPGATVIAPVVGVSVKLGVTAVTVAGVEVVDGRL